MRCCWNGPAACIPSSSCKRGSRHQCSYATPYGTLLLGVYTSELRSTLTGSGGELRFAYTLDTNAGALSAHDVRISVKEVS